MSVEKRAPRPSFRTASSQSQDNLLASKDVFSFMSAETVGDLDHHTDIDDELSLPPSYPLPLILFVCVLAVIGGLVVTGVHYAILFAGCPLGLNGCNSFTPSKEKYGFFLIRALDGIPEDLIYVSSAAAGAWFFAMLCTQLPAYLSFQISGGGTVQALVAVASGERITLTAAFFRILASSVYLGTGGTLGMDGPAIQVCTAVTTFCGFALGMRGTQTQSLLASLGFAAGFAATFNSPLAGVLFAMEELSHVSSHVSRHIICIILMASIVATAVARFFHGSDELLHADVSGLLSDDVSGGSLDNVFGVRLWMLIAIPIAVVCSFVGSLTSKLLRLCRMYVLRLQRRFQLGTVTVLAAIISSSLGSVVFRSTGLRGVWGIGYESLQKAFEQNFTVLDYLIIASGKILATIASVAVRAPGDLLEPVLLTGAFLGGGVGRMLQGLSADDHLGQNIMQPCIVFGMVAFFASCFRFPLTPVLIVLEVVGIETYALVLPAALAAFTAVTVSNKMFVPLLDIIMHEDGIDLHGLADLVALEEAAVRYDGDEPEPEENDQSIPSSSPSFNTQVSVPSVSTSFRGIEASILSLSAPHTRSSSRSNSGATQGSVKSPNSDHRINVLLETLRDSHARREARSESGSSKNTGFVSLNIPESTAGRSKRRVGSSASDPKWCDGCSRSGSSSPHHSSARTSRSNILSEGAKPMNPPVRKVSTDGSKAMIAIVPAAAVVHQVPSTPSSPRNAQTLCVTPAAPLAEEIGVTRSSVGEEVNQETVPAIATQPSMLTDSDDSRHEERSPPSRNEHPLAPGGALATEVIEPALVSAPMSSQEDKHAEDTSAGASAQLCAAEGEAVSKALPQDQACEHENNETCPPLGPPTNQIPSDALREAYSAKDTQPETNAAEVVQSYHDPET